jgi:hypothetical protein
MQQFQLHPVGIKAMHLIVNIIQPHTLSASSLIPV